MCTPHTKYQSESTLRVIVYGFEQRFHNRADEAYEANRELERRRLDGGERCGTCNGNGWFKERGPFSNDEICEDCGGLGTQYHFASGLKLS